jgi:hypothetical protein
MPSGGVHPITTSWDTIVRVVKRGLAAVATARRPMIELKEEIASKGYELLTPHLLEARL